MDIKLKGKIENRKSIARKLLIINILVFIIMAIFTFQLSNSIVANKSTTANLISVADSIYVHVSQEVNLNSNTINEYIDSLANEYNINIAITDTEGNVKIKTREVSEEKINIDEIINYKLNTTGDTKKFVKMYNIRNEDKDIILIVYKYRNVFSDMVKPWLSMLVLICGTLLIVYLLTLKKLRDLNYICDGIIKIGHGALEYRLNKSSDDEFGVLTDEINKMSDVLKSKIENEKNVYKFKNDLITNISHDLRTPLTSLIGYIQLLQGLNVDEIQREQYTKKALGKAMRLKVLIDDLFEYSKLESGEVVLEKHNINLIELIEQCIGEFSNLANKRNLHIEKLYDISEVKVLGDGELLIRVLENILGNAVKYSEHSSRIEINVIDDKESVTIMFKNKSKELIAGNVNRLFERFYRTDESRNQEISGSGLGLFIAKSIVELHSGEIWIEAEEYEFKVDLRLYK